MPPSTTPSLTLTDTSGNVLTWVSPGVVGFKGSRKGTPFAAQTAAEKMIERMREFGVRSIVVLTKGTGGGSELRDPDPQGLGDQGRGGQEHHPGAPQLELARLEQCFQSGGNEKWVGILDRSAVPAVARGRSSSSRG
jgi:hypothetical protein